MNTILNLLQRIEALQCHEDNPYFFSGIIPSVRKHRYLPFAARKDNNIFFTASTVLTLNTIRHLLHGKEYEIADNIACRATVSYEKFIKEKDGRLYNFYPMSPQSHFPNGKLLSRFRGLELPCDADTTCLAYSTSPEPDQHLLKEKLRSSSMRKTGRKSNLSVNGYDLEKVYTTWLGTEKMPLEYSVCVISNILYWVIKRQLTWDKYDQASLDYIYQIIEKGHHLSKPFAVSIHYPSPSLIIYHITRLLCMLDMGNTFIIEKMKTDMIQLLKEPGNSAMEKLMLQTSLMRLGVPVHAPVVVSKQDQEEYAFFIASFMSYLPGRVLNRMGKYPVFQLAYTCEGFNVAMTIEHLAYLRNQGAQNTNRTLIDP